MIYIPSPRTIRPCQGFTLLEMSVVLTVIGLILGASITALVLFSHKSQQDVTQQKLTLLQKTLLDYRKAFNRLPCPGDLTTDINTHSFGLEAANPGTGNCISGSPTANFGPATNTVMGMIPTKTLGLPDDMAFDGWGRRIYYAADARMTAKATATLPAAFLRHPISEDATGAIGSILIEDANGNSRTTNAVYLLMSAGENGRGAYGRGASTTRLAIHAGDAREAKNCDCGTNGSSTAFDNTFVQMMPIYNSTPTASFDDLVVFANRADMPGYEE